MILSINYNKQSHQNNIVKRIKNEAIMSNYFIYVLDWYDFNYVDKHRTLTFVYVNMFLILAFGWDPLH